MPFSRSRHLFCCCPCKVPLASRRAVCIASLFTLNRSLELFAWISGCAWGCFKSKEQQQFLGFVSPSAPSDEVRKMLPYSFFVCTQPIVRLSLSLINGRSKKNIFSPISSNMTELAARKSLNVYLPDDA